MQEKIHFRNKLMKLRLNDVIDKETYVRLSKLSLSELNEDFILAQQILRMILITS